jgi:uncharacterized damage-inducible protein DinB
MNGIGLLLMELEQESQTTRRLLDLLPEDKLAWKPHQKSMTLGQLALHVAMIPDAISSAVQADSHDVGTMMMPPQPASRAQVIETFEKSQAEAVERLGEFDDAALAKMWAAKKGNRTVTMLPRGAVIRFILMNHLIHHRGQLSVYLRLLDVPLPSIYGPSADENPWG